MWGLACETAGAIPDGSAFSPGEQMTMAGAIYPETSRELAHQRRELAPIVHAAFGREVFADGALPATTKQLMCRS
jgi:hypothetical protein